MIKTNPQAKESLKQMRERERKEKDAQLRDKCDAFASDKLGENEVKQLSNANGGLWFLPVLDEDEQTILALALMKPINRHILSFASTKIEDEGLYTFLEACMRECFVASVEPDGTILKAHDLDKSVFIADDEYFIPSAQKFNKVMEGRKVAFLKR